MLRDSRDASPPDIAGDRWALVAVAGTLSFVAMLDMGIVNVALADIGRDLDISPHIALWVMLGYQLSVVSLLLPTGRWLDGAGLRPALLTSITGFAVCSASAALSPWPAWLIASRVAQGGFGAALFVLMPVLAARAVRPELRGRAMSVQGHRGSGEQRVEQPGHGQRDRGDVVAKRPHQVAADGAYRLAGQRDRLGDDREVVTHQDHVSGLQGDVGARTDRQAQVGSGQRRPVVDPVTDHGH